MSDSESRKCGAVPVDAFIRKTGSSYCIVGLWSNGIEELLFENLPELVIAEVLYSLVLGDFPKYERQYRLF